LDAALELLLSPAFRLGATATSWGEVVGFATGVACVWLLARQSLWNWPLAIVNVVLLGVIFLRSGLYADAGLQVVYVALNAWGWARWLRGGEAHRELAVSRTPRREAWALAAAVALATAALTALLAAATDSEVPFWDAVTTAISLAAIYGQAKKRLESWWLWIAADLVYIPLYAWKELYLTSALYVVFLALCVLGLRAWRASLARQERPATA
jgi:nicotinamide mononucleotide transporter